MSHANAALTPRARLRLARLIVEDRWLVIAPAKMFMVSPVTARKWANRYRFEGAAGMADPSSRPHSMPAKTSPDAMRRTAKACWPRRLGPVQVGGKLGMPASTGYAVLVRCRFNRLSRINRVTGEPIRRYEHDHPGAMIHVDITKFGDIPDGGGWRYVGRQQGYRNSSATSRRTGERGANYRPKLGISFVHTLVDDYSRVAYAEICADETAATAIGVLRRAIEWFAQRGVSVERVLSDNGSAYKSHAWLDACAELVIRTKTTRPTGPKRTATSRDAIALSGTGGPMHGTTNQTPNAAKTFPVRCTSTISTGATPQSEPRPSTG